MSKIERKYPKGYWMATGISIGIAIGVAMSPIFENIGIGIAIGVAIGSGIGAALEKVNIANIRPLTEQEQKRRKVVLIISLALTSILALTLLIAYFVTSR